jgi:LPS export ABC transporter permease LptG
MCLMRILSRYILREFLVPLAYCMAMFLGIYILFELISSFDDLLKAKPPFLTVVAYFIGYLSPFFIWLFPAALMLAALYTMWNFCRHSEITAMRANGIGFIVIVRPLLVVATCAMVLVALLNEFYTPGASEWAWKFRDDDFKQDTKSIRENIPYYNQLDLRIWRINRIDLNHPHILEGVRLSFDRPDKSRMLDITARRAEYLDGVWWFFNPQYQYFDELNDPVVNPYTALESLSIRSFPELSETPRDFLVMNKKVEHSTTRDLIHDLKKNPLLNKRESVLKRYEIGSRLIAPFSCLVITLFAIPAGVVTGRQSVFKGVIAAVAMFFSFYGTAILCEVAAKNMYLPVTLAVLFPNLLFLGLGMYLFYRQR